MGPKKHKNESHGTYVDDRYVNPKTNNQGNPQYVHSVGQDSSCHQQSVASPYKAAYMSQDHVKSQIGKTQSYISVSRNVSELPQGQTYIGPNQNNPSTGFDPHGSFQVSSSQISSSGDSDERNLENSSSESSEIPVFGRGRNFDFQKEIQRGSSFGQPQYRSHGKQYAGQSPYQLTAGNQSDQSFMRPEEKYSDGLINQNHLPYSTLENSKDEIRSGSRATSIQRVNKPNNQGVLSFAFVDFQGERVQCKPSDGGVGRTNSNQYSNKSEKFVHDSDPLTVGTTFPNTPEVPRYSGRLKIDPIRGPPPAFTPAARKISISSTQGEGSLSQYANSPPDNLLELSVIKRPPSKVDNRLVVSSGNSGPLVIASTPKRSVSHTVCSSLSLTGSPFGAIQTSYGSLTPIKMQPRKIWPSPHMAQISPNGAKPSLEVAFDPQNLPFMELGRRSSPVDHGVVRISNVPYHITRSEIVAFLGRNARIINENDEPIHIIMERVTSKTMDAFVEFINISEAVNAVNRYEQNRANGRPGRLGERHVDVELSSQAQLMADLFPKARNVKWHGARPEIIPVRQNDPYNSGFQGFLSREELIMIVKHVETPSRSPFSRDCPQRPWECLISTLIKFPWYMTDCITVDQRNLLYVTALSLVKNLNERINSGPEDLQINHRLLRRVLRACFRCAGFTEAQKDSIAFTLGIDPAVCGLTIYADHWYPFSSLGPKPGIPTDVLLYYMALLRDATTSPAHISLGERAADDDDKPPCVFGNLKFEYPKNLGSCSLAFVAKLEWTTIDRLLRRVLPERE